MADCLPLWEDTGASVIEANARASSGSTLEQVLLQARADLSNVMPEPGQERQCASIERAGNLVAEASDIGKMFHE